MEKNPCLILLVMFILLLAWTAAVQTDENTTDTGPGISPVMFFFILLVLCTVIGIFAVLAGVGGGVIFTPLLMGFTNIDSLIIRTTGLFIAMAGALIAARPYLRKGITNIRLLFLGAIPYAVFAIIGAMLAGYMHSTMGTGGEALIRGILGVLVLGIGILFLCAGGKTEYPVVENTDGLSKKLCLDMTYWEDSLNKSIYYKVKRAGIGLILFCAVGFTSGLFGLGAGWAIVPVFNLVMLTPLKVSATCSTVMISIGDTAAVWPYITGGGMFPLIVVPCMIGMVVGSFIGAKIMFKVKPRFIRWVIIVVMFCAGARLISKAFSMVSNGT